MEIIIKLKDIIDFYEIEEPCFPKYSTQILNIAVSTSQATRPRVVGQMTELIEEFPGDDYENWIKWYNMKKPDSIEKAADKAYEYIQKFKEVIDSIDREMVKKYIEDLVFTKTFTGLKLQKIILSRVSDFFNTNYKLSTPAEESQGIDGFINDIPVSIKPISYKYKTNLNEEIQCKMIYYSKNKKNIKIIFEDKF
ncbi:MAG: MjaI family restriction endonuclease [Candidatus Muiribacteriota bacterium]